MRLKLLFYIFGSCRKTNDCRFELKLKCAIHFRIRMQRYDLKRQKIAGKKTRNTFEPLRNFVFSCLPNPTKPLKTGF